MVVIARKHKSDQWCKVLNECVVSAGGRWHGTGPRWEAEGNRQSSPQTLVLSAASSFLLQCSWSTTLWWRRSADSWCWTGRRSLAAGCSDSPWSRCWAFFTTAAVFAVKERSAAMWTPRYLKDSTLSTHTPLRNRGAATALFFPKSRMNSLVLAVFRVRLFTEHHSSRRRTSSRLAASFSPVIKPAIVVLTTSKEKRVRRPDSQSEENVIWASLQEGLIALVDVRLELYPQLCILILWIYILKIRSAFFS